jgi:methionyl-tRNA formyltransferase
MQPTLLCLGTKKGYAVLQEAAALGDGPRFHVCSLTETNVVESYKGAIDELARQGGMVAASWAEFRSRPVEFLRERSLGAILCIGWRYLVPEAAIRHLCGEVVIAHDALLPRLRGFAPLPTALIAGEPRTGVTFLKVGQATDDGDILWQQGVDIGPQDTIAALIEKVLPLYREGARLYLRGQLTEGRRQDHAQATYSIWRDRLDLFLDWSQSAETLERTIRALGPPYEGARSRLGGKEVVLHRAAVVPDLPFAIRQPGKVWSLDAEGRPTVVCGTGLLKILAASREGASILPLKTLRQRFGL